MFIIIHIEVTGIFCCIHLCWIFRVIIMTTLQPYHLMYDDDTAVHHIPAQRVVDMTYDKKKIIFYTTSAQAYIFTTNIEVYQRYTVVSTTRICQQTIFIYHTV